jgi:hypothetical protein
MVGGQGVQIDEEFRLSRFAHLASIAQISPSSVSPGTSARTYNASLSELSLRPKQERIIAGSVRLTIDSHRVRHEYVLFSSK